MANTNKPPIYKKIAFDISQTKQVLSSDEQTKVTNILNNFITYFKAKHT
tara:strand:+ start:745 stop:891 length:147 start_codon:yes stop_codon:yes gene_type:complete